MIIKHKTLGLPILVVLLFFSACNQSQNDRQNFEAKVIPNPIESNLNEGVDPKNPSVIYRSLDLGASWSSFDEGIPKDATVSGIKQERDRLYIVTDTHGIFVRSGDDPKWRALSSESTLGLDINCIEVDGTDMVIGTLKNGIFTSKDGGSSWNRASGNIQNLAIRAFYKADKYLLAGTDKGIFISMNMGETWEHSFGDIQILGFTFMQDKIYAATQHGALVCKGDLQDWKSIYQGDPLHDIGNDGTYVYAMTIGQQLLKSKNDGEQWENAQNGIIQPANFYTNELQHIGPHIFSAQWIGIYHSTNHGTTWRKLDGLPKSTAFSTLEITDFGIIAGISIR